MEPIVMDYLSEDPTYLAGGLGVVAVAFLIALWITQQGKYLVAAGMALVLALVVVVVERAWVTDGERIEQVIEDLRRAVENSDVEGVDRHLTPDVEYVQGDNTVAGDRTRAFIRMSLAHAVFDFVRVSHLTTDAGHQSRRGSAEFRVMAKGVQRTSFGTVNIGTTGSEWSLGLQETSPKVWKVNRISPIRVPYGMARP